MRTSKSKKVLIDTDSEAVFKLADGFTVRITADNEQLSVIASHEGGGRIAIEFEKGGGNAGTLTVTLLPDSR
jgi:hypothetical protein